MTNLPSILKLSPINTASKQYQHTTNIRSPHHQIKLIHLVDCHVMKSCCVYLDRQGEVVLNHNYDIGVPWLTYKNMTMFR